MEDDNGLELSLGLGFGGSSSKPKSKNGSTPTLDSGTGSPANELGKPDNDVAINLNNKRPEASNKRKIPFDETSNVKKLSRVPPTEDGSSAENEDVAESEVEGSTSRLVNRLDDVHNQFIGASGHSEVAKEIIGLSDSRLNGSSENDFKQGNLNDGVQYSVQPTNIVSMAFPFQAKESSSAGVTSTPGPMQSANQSVNSGKLPVMFGYAPVQLPTLDKENSWGLVSQLQQFQPPYAGRGPPNAAIQVMGRNVSEHAQYNTTASERIKGEGKQHITKEGSSSRAEEDNNKGSTMNLIEKEVPERPTPEGFTFDLSAIRPGIGPGVKFGGSGSYPNLPWVSTTGPGPNGRTISGVTYRFSSSQIRIVCACHGSHMSPEEFVQHASEENADTVDGLSAFTSTNNPAASAQS